MKIQDLFENIPNRMTEHGEQLPFDLKDDLIFFMRNDDEFYRRHYYPHVIKCIEHVKQGKNLNSKVFEPMVKHAYECYSQKFNIRELPESLDEEMCNEICSTINTEEHKHINNDIY
jgi:hypothetical protein